MEEYFYRYDWERLGACRPVFHQLRHVAEAIRWAGPMYVYWQYPMERLCGMIKFQIKSRQKTNVNIANVQMMVEQTNLLPFVLDHVDADHGPAHFDQDGNYLLEKILARAFNKKKKANRFITEAFSGKDWDWNDVFSDLSCSETSSNGESLDSSSDEGVSARRRKARSKFDTNRRFSFKRISKYRRLVNAVPKRFLYRKFSPFQQTIIREFLTAWYESGDYDHDLDEDTVKNLLQAPSDTWKELMSRASLWRSMDIKTVTRVGEYVARSRRSRITGMEHRRTNSTRSSAMVELKESPNTNKKDPHAYPGRFAETQLFVSIPIPLKKIPLAPAQTVDNKTCMMVGKEVYSCFELHIAILREVPVRREGILVEARMGVKGRKLYVESCDEIRCLVGMMVSRDRKFIVWEHGCFDWDYVEEYEKGYDWKSEIKQAIERRTNEEDNYTVDEDEIGLAVDDPADTHFSDLSADTEVDTPERMEEDDCNKEAIQINDTASRENDVYDENDSREEDDDSDHVNHSEDTDLVEVPHTWKNSSDPLQHERLILVRLKDFCVVRKVKGDGNCGYRVIASAVPSLGRTILHKSVRTAISDMFKAQRERYMSDAYTFVRHRESSDFASLLRDMKGQSKGTNIWFVTPWHAQLVADCYGVFVAVLPNSQTMRMDLFAPRNDEWSQEEVLRMLCNETDTPVIGMLNVRNIHWDWVDFDWKSMDFRSLLRKLVNERALQVQWGARPKTADL